MENLSEEVVPYEPSNGIVGNPKHSWRTRALYAEECLLRERQAIDTICNRTDGERDKLRIAISTALRRLMHSDPEWARSAARTVLEDALANRG